MKTIKQHLSELPDPFNHLALEACEEFRLTSKRKNKSDAVLSMCKWDESEMCHEFWIGVFLELKHLEK